MGEEEAWQVAAARHDPAPSLPAPGPAADAVGIAIDTEPNTDNDPRRKTMAHTPWIATPSSDDHTEPQGGSASAEKILESEGAKSSF